MSGTHRGLAGHVRRVTVEDWAFQQIGKKNRPASIFPLRSGGGGDTLLAMRDTKINDGGPAFPIPVAHPFGDGRMAIGGMSLREMFAGQALVGILSNHTLLSIVDASVETPTHRAAAKYAVACADSLLAELKEGEAALGSAPSIPNSGPTTSWQKP